MTTISSAAWAQNQARELGAEMASQPLGGALFPIRHLLPFAADALSYVASLVTLLFVQPISRPARGNPTVNLAAWIAEGLVWLWRQPLALGDSRDRGAPGGDAAHTGGAHRGLTSC